MAGIGREDLRFGDTVLMPGGVVAHTLEKDLSDCCHYKEP